MGEPKPKVEPKLKAEPKPDSKPKPKAKVPKPSKSSATELDLGLRRAWGPFLGLMLPVLLLVVFALCQWPAPWWHGPRLRHAWNTDDTKHLALAVGGAGLAVCAFWIVIPVAHWLRCAPLERFRGGNRWAWLLPLLVATPAWIALYLAALGCVALGGYAAISGLLQFGVPELLRAWRD
jgi:hypothetical protein